MKESRAGLVAVSSQTNKQTTRHTAHALVAYTALHHNNDRISPHHHFTLRIYIVQKMRASTKTAAGHVAGRTAPTCRPDLPILLPYWYCTFVPELEEHESSRGLATPVKSLGRACVRVTLVYPFWPFFGGPGCTFCRHLCLCRSAHTYRILPPLCPSVSNACI